MHAPHVYADVRAFHRAFGQYLAETPSVPPAKVRALRVAVICEEYHELLRAVSRLDRVETADAIADLIYVLAGTALCFHPTPLVGGPQAAHPVSPMETAKRLTGCILIRLSNDDPDPEGVVQTVDRLIAVLFHQARKFDLPLGDVWRAVHASNLAKVGGGEREDGKVLKPADWTAPDVAGIVLRHDADRAGICLASA